MTTEPEIVIEEESSSEIGNYIRILFQKKWSIIILTVLISLASVMYYSMMPDLYVAKANIVFEKPDVRLRGTGEILQDGRTDRDFYGTQIAILTGRDVSSAVRKELNPPSNYSVWASNPKDTRIISIYVKHQDPEWAARIANKYAEIFVKESAKEGLYAAEQFLQWLPTEGQLLDSESSIKQMQEMGFDQKEFIESMSIVMNDPMMKKYKDEELEIKSKLANLSDRYKSGHPVIVDLNKRLRYLEGESAIRMEKIVGNLRAKLTGKMAITNMRILERALPPSNPSEPDRSRGILLWSLAGFIFVSGSVILLNSTNQKINLEGDLRPAIQLPFLGYIPDAKEISRDKKNGAKAGENYSIANALHKDSTLADAVASVRTHVLFSMPYEHSKKIMVTSTLPNEGKTTVAALLATSFRSLGRSVLLIDADMRRPYVHKLLNLNNSRGLTDYLVGDSKIDEIIQSVPNTDLKVITTGNETPNPSELLGSERFKDLLDDVSKKFDRIVIDIAPVLYIPDGLIVAKHIHSGILVCGSGMVTKRAVKEVKDKFDSIGHSFIGLIINRANLSSHDYKAFHAYKKHYAKK